MQDRLIITNFTDPVCTWCWGSEPVIRKLETHFPDLITFRYVMGGLVKDINQFRDQANSIGGIDMDENNKQIANHWLEASERHGMPVKVEGFALFSQEYQSTYPQNIAYKAAQLVDQEKADKFLRRMREAATTEALVISREDVQVSLASEVGIDIPKFLLHLKDGSAEKAFQGDLNLCRALGVRGFPTFEVKYNSQKVMMRGYQRFEDFVAVISMVTGDSLKPLSPEKSDEALLSFMNKHSSLAAEEIKQAFNLNSIQEVDEWVERLIKNGDLEKIPAGNGYMLKKINSSLSCDAETGICN